MIYRLSKPYEKIFACPLVPDVRKYDASYDNGKAIILPRPSKLDLNGKTPKGYANPEGIQYSGRNSDLTN